MDGNQATNRLKDDVQEGPMAGPTATAKEDQIQGGKNNRKKSWRQWRQPVCTTLFAVVVLAPDLLRLDQWTPFSQIIAFRPLLASFFFISAGLLLFRQKSRWTAAAVLVATSLIAAVLVIPRAIPAPAGSTKNAGNTTHLRILAANVFDNNASISGVARIIQTQQPDVVVMPQGDQGYRLRLEAALDHKYVGFSQQTDDSAATALSALYRRELGEVHGDVNVLAGFPTWILRGGNLGKLQVVAYHAYPPFPFHTRQWAQDLSHIQQWCSSDQPIIVAGDFNATLDQGPFRRAIKGCTDSANALGKGLIATWPSKIPRIMGAQIDHVLFTKGIAAKSLKVIDIPGSDHRAVFTDLVISKQ